MNALNNLGVVSKELGEIPKAISYYERAIKIDPYYLNALNNLGVVFTVLGEISKAISYYERAIKIDPNNAKTFYNLGNAQKQLKKFKKLKTLIKNH